MSKIPIVTTTYEKCETCKGSGIQNLEIKVDLIEAGGKDLYDVSKNLNSRPENK